MYTCLTCLYMYTLLYAVYVLGNHGRTDELQLGGRPIQHAHLKLVKSHPPSLQIYARPSPKSAITEEQRKDRKTLRCSLHAEPYQFF